MSLGGCKAVDLHNLPLVKPAFIALGAGEYMLGDYQGGACVRIGKYHSYTSRVNPKCYAPRVYLGVLLNKRKEWEWGLYSRGLQVTE